MLRIIQFDLSHYLQLRNILLMTLFFLALAIFNVFELLTITGNASIADLFLFVFGGVPEGLYTNVWFILRWIITYMIFVLLFGQMLTRDFAENRLYLLIRIKSKQTYIFSKMITLVLFTFVYVLIGFVIVYVVGGLSLTKEMSFSSEFRASLGLEDVSFSILHLFILEILGFLCVGMLLILLGCFSRLSKHSAVVAAVLLFLNTKLFTIWDSLHWFAFLQKSMSFLHVKSLHHPIPYKIENSTLYLTCIFVLLFLLTAWIFHKKDVSV
ncbi:hypothetical protein [Paenibacillus turpanensis]|uniref:hypothetical protein n=1 Tax=Paenibacillus turpanensis TaxID=2689078 RepID=UPI00140D6A85|nr:hypothetical protein [Paenibacillus turpanensis]